MRTFLDSQGRSWCVALDGFLLGDVRDQCKVDLATAAGWHAIETDEVQLVRALAVICRDEISERKMKPAEFARALVGESIDAARQAVLEAAAAFFPPKRWSEIAFHCSQQREASHQWAAIRPMMAVLNEPDMPAAMRDAVMGMLADMLRSLAPTDSRNFAGQVSAPGPGESRENAASGSPGSSESVPTA